MVWLRHFLRILLVLLQISKHLTQDVEASISEISLVASSSISDYDPDWRSAVDGDLSTEPFEDRAISGFSTVIVSTSSTFIDATTLVILSTSSSWAPDAVQPTTLLSTEEPSSPEITTRFSVDQSSLSLLPVSTPSISTTPGKVSTLPSIPKTTQIVRQPTAGGVVVTNNQFPSDTEVSCDFGTYPVPTLCGWTVVKVNKSISSPVWRLGAGVSSNWVGGPSIDARGNKLGGYAFAETSEGAKETRVLDMTMLMSPLLKPTGLQGACLSFMYSMTGLSARGLRIILLRNSTTESVMKELWHSSPPGTAEWHQGQLLYSQNQPYYLLLEASSTRSSESTRSYRGHIAVDDIRLMPGLGCSVSCSFAGGLCHWTNDADDDFDWTMGMGSSNTITGPATPVDPSTQFDAHLMQHLDLPDDLMASLNLDSKSMMQEQLGRSKQPGGYVYIDSSYPRRPNDVARLVSDILPASNSLFPQCLRFWFHMFGVDVGSLRIALSPTNRTLWTLAGDAGNSWYRGAVTLSENQPFRVVIEATVGAVGMSDIAVDDISLEVGPCPVSPQVAGMSQSASTDCSLEVDECSWRGMESVPGSAVWKRVQVRTLPSSLQRRPHGPALQNDYFLGLDMPASVPDDPVASLSKLVSPLITSDHQPLCFAFWYLIDESVPVGFSSSGLGALRVNIRRQKENSDSEEEDHQVDPPISSVWALYNTQGPAWRQARVPLPANQSFSIEMEGEWSPGQHSGILALDDFVLYHAKCPSVPASAQCSPVDCSFSVHSCGWSGWINSGWQLATAQHRPARLTDNTFHAPGGYAFFDMFSPSQRVRRAHLVSPVIEIKSADSPMCCTFWFAAFGLGESTRLKIIRRDQEHRLPDITVWKLEARGIDTARPQWAPAQATFSAHSDFSIVLDGEAINGGFAVDDIRIVPGFCATRPVNAVPNS